VFEETSVALQPLALTLTSTGGRLVVKWEESDFVLINFETSDPEITVNIHYKMMATGSTIVINGQDMVDYAVIGALVQGLTYYGKQVGHKSYAKVVSTLGFHKAELNCFDQSTTYAESFTSNALTWSLLSLTEGEGHSHVSNIAHSYTLASQSTVSC